MGLSCSGAPAELWLAEAVGLCCSLTSALSISLPLPLPVLISRALASKHTEYQTPSESASWKTLLTTKGKWNIQEKCNSHSP